MNMVTPETRFHDPAPNAELLRSLGRMVRGLSALFWALPIAMIVCVQTANTGGLDPRVMRGFHFLAPIVATGWLVFGLWQLGSFQKQERVWIAALDRAKWLGLTEFGLSPFLYWGNRRPDEPYFILGMGAMAIGGLLFLDALNFMLRRLSAMLPDENLRQETRHFTMLNRLLLLGILIAAAAYLYLLRHPQHYPAIGNFLISGPLESAGWWALLFLVLVPLAITMALIWKIKEVILESVFGA